MNSLAPPLSSWLVYVELGALGLRDHHRCSGLCVAKVVQQRPPGGAKSSRGRAGRIGTPHLPPAQLPVAWSLSVTCCAGGRAHWPLPLAW